MLDRVKARVGDPVVKQMIVETPAAIPAPGKWDAQACTNKFVEVIEQSGVTTDLAYHLDLYRNHLASAVLLSFERPYLLAVWTDFVSAFDISECQLATFPIATTRYCFGRIREMPQLTKLATFRGPVAEATLAAQERTPYYWLVDTSFRNLLLVWAALTLGILTVKPGRKIVGFSIVLICVAITIVLSTCFLSELLPRFMLPFWVLYVGATLLSLACICDKIVDRTSAKVDWLNRPSG